MPCRPRLSPPYSFQVMPLNSGLKSSSGIPVRSYGKVRYPTGSAWTNRRKEISSTYVPTMSYAASSGGHWGEKATIVTIVTITAPGRGNAREDPAK